MVTPNRLRNCRAFTCNARSLTFARGATVFANWQGRGSWYSGRIRIIDQATCSYTIYYADGDREVGVRQNAVCPRPARYRVGQSVQANWQGKGRYYPGRIVAVQSGIYSITYSDGDRETKVPCDRIRT